MYANLYEENEGFRLEKSQATPNREYSDKS